MWGGVGLCRGRVPYLDAVVDTPGGIQASQLYSGTLSVSLSTE